MKSILLLLPFLFFCLYGSSQVDSIHPCVFKTSNDFLNNNLLKYEKHTKTLNLFAKKVFFIDSLNNEVIYNLRKDSIWGYNDMFGNTIRQYKNNPWTLLEQGIICVYGRFPEFSKGPIFAEPKQSKRPGWLLDDLHSNEIAPGPPSVYISLGLDGELLKVIGIS